MITLRYTPYLLSLALLGSTSWAETNNTKTNTDKLEEITITASKVPLPLRNVGSSISILNAEDLEVKSYLPLAETLRTLASVNVSNAGGLGKNTAVRIRGEEHYRTLLLIDGINVSDTTAPQISPRFDHLMNSQIGRVEVLRGPQGMMYGADGAGVISLFSKQSKERFEADVNLETGRYDSHLISANARGEIEKFNYSLSSSYLTSNGFNANTSDISEETDGYDNQTVHFNGGYQIIDTLNIGLILRNVEGRSEYDQCFSSTPNDCVSDYTQTSFRTFLIHTNNNLTGELSYTSSKTENEYFTGPDNLSTNANEGSIERYSYAASYKFSDNYTLAYGLDSKEEFYENLIFGGERKRRQNGIYTEAIFSPTSQLHISTGLRHDANQDFGDYTSPRINLAYLIDVGGSEIKLKSSFSTGFRAPSLYEENNSQGDLKEEISKGYEAGVEFIHHRVQAEITYFNNKITDEIFYFYDSATFEGNYLQAKGQTRSKGIDGRIEFNILKNLTLDTNYTYNITKVNDNLSSYDVRLRRPINTYNISLDYSLLNNTLNVGISYRSSSNAIDLGNVKLDDYHVIDLNSAYQISPLLQIYARITNAENDKYQEVNAYNTAGSAAYLGLRLKL